MPSEALGSEEARDNHNISVLFCFSFQPIDSLCLLTTSLMHLKTYCYFIHHFQLLYDKRASQDSKSSTSEKSLLYVYIAKDISQMGSSGQAMASPKFWLPFLKYSSFKQPNRQKHCVRVHQLPSAKMLLCPGVVCGLCSPFVQLLLIPSSQNRWHSPSVAHEERSACLPRGRGRSVAADFQAPTSSTWHPYIKPTVFQLQGFIFWGEH